MKVKNLNKSSIKTKALIKETFIEMLGEKKELSNINVSDLVKKANINRSTFYAHYDNIYDLAKEYENEIIDTFYTSWHYIENDNFEMFLDSFFTFIKANDHKFKMLCSSNEVFFAIAKLNEVFKEQLIKLYHKIPNLINTKYIDLEINTFTDGMLYNYLKYCRGYGTYSLNDLQLFANEWYKDFRKKHIGGITNEA